jgi:hypothetical protein
MNKLHVLWTTGEKEVVKPMVDSTAKALKR